MRACEYRTSEVSEQARTPMYNHNAVRLYLGISCNRYLLILPNKPCRVYTQNRQTDWKQQLIYSSKRGERMNTLCCTPDYFALFLYVRSDNKVKSISIMVVRVEMIFLTVLCHHPFIAKKGGNFDRLVVTELYALQSISFFQPLQIVVITADITIGKNGI